MLAIFKCCWYCLSNYWSTSHHPNHYHHRPPGQWTLSGHNNTIKSQISKLLFSTLLMRRGFYNFIWWFYWLIQIPKNIFESNIDHCKYQNLWNRINDRYMLKLLNLEAKIRGEIEENIDVRPDSCLCTRINHLDVFRYFMWASRRSEANTFEIF